MKSIEFKSFEERINEVRKRNVKLCKFHSKCQKMIDYVRFSSWLVSHKTAEVNIEVNSDWYANNVTFYISNVQIDEFIENILGPIHRDTNTLWEMEIVGSESDPVMQFDEIGKSYNLSYCFRVKEGEFNQCKVVKKIVDFSEAREAEPIHRLVIECE